MKEDACRPVRSCGRDGGRESDGNGPGMVDYDSGLNSPPLGSPANFQDIWSLGCTLYALAYGHSPFEVEGSSVVLAVRNGQYKFPNNDKVYSQGLRDLIKFMLVVDPKKRPDIHAVRTDGRRTVSRKARGLSGEA